MHAHNVRVAARHQSCVVYDVEKERAERAACKLAAMACFDVLPRTGHPIHIVERR